jgi:hypothetical protein
MVSDSDFSATVKAFAAHEVARRLGCPLTTVYSWRSGARLPPDWQRGIILDRLLADGPASDAPAGRGKGRPRKPVQ